MLEEKYNSGLRASTSASDVVGVEKDHPVRRVIIHFYSDLLVEGALIKDYYVWLTEDYTCDALHLETKPTDNEYALAALQETSRRSQDCDYGVPPENGLDCSNSRGIIHVDNVDEYAYPLGE
jgi:hypothetical protein